MKKLLILFLCLFLLGGIFTQTADAGYYNMAEELPDDVFVDISYLTDPSVSAEQYRWYWNAADQFPIEFEFAQGSDDISDGSDFMAISNAMSSWTNVPGSNLTTSFISYDGDWAVNNSENEIAWVESGWEERGYKSSAIAVTVTYYFASTSTQIESDILLNGEFFTWYTDSDDSGTETQHVEHIMLHELGHAFSLVDLYDGGDSERTMYGYTSSRDEDVTLHSYDNAALAQAYPVTAPEPVSSALFVIGAVTMGFRRLRK